MPRAALVSLSSPLLSLVVYSIGHGMMTTLLTLRMAEEMVSVQWIGAVSASYFAGLLVGSFVNSKVILRVGHVRAYAAYASLLCSLALLYGLVFDPMVWMGLRLLGGFAAGGLFVVIESWIMVSAPVKLRGRIMAIYMVLFYAAMASGQMLLKHVDIMVLVPFALSALAASLSVIPLMLSKVDMPQITRHEKLSVFTLMKLTPTGVMSCFVSGLYLSVAYGLLPLFFAQVGYNVEDIANMMAVMIIGGMCLQYPLGRLSDRLDRRIVLVGLFVSTLVISLMFVLFGVEDFPLFTSILVFMLGGTIFAIYPISLSQACDELPTSQVISGNQGLLLVYSIGAMIGPLLAPLFLMMLGASGMFSYFGLMALLTLSFLYWRLSVRPAVPLEAHRAFSASTPNTPVMAELDPRAEGAAQETIATAREEEQVDTLQR
ncbi:MFS transporter [Aliiglaciecola sp. CAU 1673]|uniref:MFS transporter n=1 Tax=Aliiglaciecola sp. CAU 1673 TaxID=3032595 RepID=UPI0023D98722|nr:MFS transporter [Aliiglaciecola sp. CAU 1673]MDF2176721.1 MFS transporter [Aliiglaciecola sp. CAU 1673]